MFRRRTPLSTIDRIRNNLFPKTGMVRAWRYHWKRLKRLNGSPHTIAIGFSIGVFASFSPFLGLHMILALIIAWLLRASIVSTLVGTTLGNPLTYPFIWFGSYGIGNILLGRNNDGPVDGDMEIGSVFPGIADASSGVFQDLLLPLFVGGTILGGIVAAVCYWFVARSIHAHQERRRNRLKSSRVMDTGTGVQA